MATFTGLIEIDAEESEKLGEFAFQDTDGKLKIAYELDTEKVPNKERHELASLFLIAPTETPENEHRFAAAKMDVLFYPHLTPSTTIDDTNEKEYASALLDQYLKNH